jgi:uncharacterized protein YndB with AHSA1/START domain
VLKHAGLVTDLAHGTRRIYRVNYAGIQAIHAYLDQILSQVLAGFQRAADRIALQSEQNAHGGGIMSQTTFAPVRYSVTVPIPANRAFTLFTEGFNTWWIGHHIGQADLAEAVLEPREGGRWYERGVDGSECDWGTVLTYQPPERLVVTWQINSHLQYDPDRARASEVEVLFTEKDGHTRVDLEHRYIDRHGEGADVVARYVSGDGGWPPIMEGYANAAVA